SVLPLVKVKLTDSRTGNCSTFATLRKEQDQGLTYNPNESLSIPSRPSACLASYPASSGNPSLFSAKQNQGSFTVNTRTRSVSP
ncbi:hypothetical protein, partial [Stenotrophomonas sp. GbtcB23]|uniref:hypothetical protein n=1 Tax=Stenotrophomonas sp. GbtcB23 TaxID=2824768 RepID=UPI001C310B9F